jgi:Family of unknown function (DUF6636)
MRVLLTALLLLGLAPATAAAKFGSFKTPSHNVVCDWSYGFEDSPPIVICSIKSGLKPPPPHRDCRGAGDYTDHIISLQLSGHSREASCAGDPGPLVSEPKAKVLHYGSTWRHGKLRCTSRRSGLTCRNKSGHGFTLRRARTTRF